MIIIRNLILAKQHVELSAFVIVMLMGYDNPLAIQLEEKLAIHSTAQHRWSRSRASVDGFHLSMSVAHVNEHVHVNGVFFVYPWKNTILPVCCSCKISPGQGSKFSFTSRTPKLPHRVQYWPQWHNYIGAWGVRNDWAAWNLLLWWAPSLSVKIFRPEYAFC